MRNILKASLVAGALFTLSAPAFAGGFLADTFIRPFSPQAADAADQWHAQAGHPLEQIGGAVAQSYGVPVSAKCLTPQGVVFGPFLPIGAPCAPNGVWGVIIN